MLWSACPVRTAPSKNVTVMLSWMFGRKLSYVIPLIARAAALGSATKDMDLSDTPSPWQIHAVFPPKQNSSLLKSSSSSSDAFKLTMPPAHHTDMIRLNGRGQRTADVPCLVDTLTLIMPASKSLSSTWKPRMIASEECCWSLLLEAPTA